MSVGEELGTRCTYCGRAVDPLARSTWRRVVGWERKATAASRRGGSDIALRESRDEYACTVCVTRLQGGVGTGQEAML